MGYGSDLSDAQWEILEPILNGLKKDGRGPEVVGGMRNRINAILYVNKTGCQWRQLPKDFGSWNSVYSTFYRLKQRGAWEQVLHILRKRSRTKAGRKEEPTVAIIDSQSTKTVLKGGDAGTTRVKRSRDVNGI